jgi:two-component system sensor histidine kinase VicK
MSEIPYDFRDDIDVVNRIPVISSILEVICRTTGMGFAAVARVTEDRWVALSVKDDINFGLTPGGELKIETTMCNEIRQTGNGIVVDHVELDKHYKHHHTPAMYGFQSYISLPIIKKDGSFFGTLCAIDPKPAKINTPEIISMFKLFADLISFHLNAIEQLSVTEALLAEEKKNFQLQKDLQSLDNELVAINEEVTASNEELRAVNEELVSTNEELSLSKENLQLLFTELESSEYRTRNIIESAPFPIGVYTGREMRITFANKSITDVWGKGEDVIGKLYAEVLPELDNQAIFAQLDHVFTTGIPFQARNQRLDLVVDGIERTYYFNYNFNPLINNSGEIYGVINTAADVTDVILAKQQVEKTSYELATLNEELAAINEELTAANEEQTIVNKELFELNSRLKISQDELQLAIDAAGLATFDLNPITGRFVGNDLLKSWFGLQPEDEIELFKATDVIAETDRQRVLEAIQYSMTFRSGGDYDTYYSIINPLNPIPRIVRAKGKALFNDLQQPTRFSGVLQDVTELKQDEQRKNDFIGMVSHELKTPLTSLNAYIQILQAKAKKTEDDFTINALEKANNQAKKMTAMINGFLNVSRLEAGQIHIDKQGFDMATLIKEVEEECTVTVTSHEVVFAPVEEVFVNADQDKIGQVINNFISNAVKYSPPRSIIHVACIAINNTVQVCVQDEGMGVRPKDKEKIFDRYYRVKDQPLTISGFGIGLYVSAEIIQRHNGKIWLNSEISKGSKFCFSLPI